MLRFEKALAKQIMSPAAGVAALLRGGCQAVVLTQNRDSAPVYPAVVYTKISGESDMAHDGPTGLQGARYQLDIYAADPAVARRIADLIRGEGDAVAVGLALDGFSGTMALGADGPVRVDSMFLEDEDAQWVDEHDVHWIRQDYTVWFTEDP